MALLTPVQAQEQEKKVTTFSKRFHKLKRKKEKTSNQTSTSASSHYNSWQKFFKPFLKAAKVIYLKEFLNSNEMFAVTSTTTLVQGLSCISCS